ncbi:MAG: MBL fold metallo-hydrolase [gamma proteobacterium symbiont of Phacoides pectinatus]
MEIVHHGAVDGVTGSCHEMRLSAAHSVLVDCGQFQGTERASAAEADGVAQFPFPENAIQALLVTHCHIDHVGRIPHLIAAGFQGPIYCSEATAELLPLVLDDALRIGVTRDRSLIKTFLRRVGSQLHPLPYGTWREVPGLDGKLNIRLQRAGHILGSAYIECRVREKGVNTTVVFSGDLGAPTTPLLPPPQPPESADILILESTYGDRLHEAREQRHERLREIIERCFENRGVILIPAFSIGRTQELLYELEGIIHRQGSRLAARGVAWDEVEVILDSPLAARFTASYRKLSRLWDNEARSRIADGRHPLDFEQLTTIDSHHDHLQAVNYLRSHDRPRIVIAASGMCAGGRIVNYLKALLGDVRTDVLFAGYQARGTPGRDIQRYGPGRGYVILDGRRIDIRAGVHTLSGYSAHADQQDLVDFVAAIRPPPRQIRLVHGDDTARQALRERLKVASPGIEITIPTTRRSPSRV